MQINWEAFNGITQFLASIATVLAVFFAMYEIRRQYKTRIEAIIVPSFPYKTKDYEEIDVNIEIINKSSYPVFIKEAYFFTSKHAIRFHVPLSDNGPLKIESGCSFSSKINGWYLAKTIDCSKPSLIAELKMFDRRKFKFKYPYTEQFLVEFENMESRNAELDGYLQMREQMAAVQDEAFEQLASMWNNEASNSYFQRVSKFRIMLFKLKHILRKTKEWLIKNSGYIIIILVLLFGILLYFSIWGIIYIFKL